MWSMPKFLNRSFTLFALKKLLSTVSKIILWEMFKSFGCLVCFSIWLFLFLDYNRVYQSWLSKSWYRDLFLSGLFESWFPFSWYIRKRLLCMLIFQHCFLPWTKEFINFGFQVSSWLVGFYGRSTFVGYLTPNQFLRK